MFLITKFSLIKMNEWFNLEKSNFKLWNQLIYLICFLDIINHTHARWSFEFILDIVSKEILKECILEKVTYFFLKPPRIFFSLSSCLLRYRSWRSLSRLICSSALWERNILISRYLANKPKRLRNCKNRAVDR